MSALSGIQQMQVPLSQVASALSYVRTMSQKLRLSRQYSKPAAAIADDLQLQDLCQQANAAMESLGLDPLGLEGLGLEQLPGGVRVEDLAPVLACHACLAADSTGKTNTLGDSYVSAASFFENKNGFPADDLYSASPGLLQSSRSWPHSPFSQQVRGFRTKYRGSIGVGTRYTEESSSNKITDWVDKLPLKAKQEKSQPEKLRTMVKDYEHQPEMQEQIKVAFAEGYSASKGGDERKSKLLTLLRSTGWALFWTFIAWQLIKFFSSGIAGDMKVGLLKSGIGEINPEDISVMFNDVKGVDEAKQELKDVVEFLRDPDKFRALGAKLPKGVLLVGPPGIGKTLLARAVAGEAGVPFFHASGSEFDEVFVGMGAQRVRKLFDAAKMRSPCVIFIDEIDTVGAKRTSSQIHPYANQTINQLLSEMDGFQQNEGVIVLGATNRRDNLDSALLRPGRFDVEVRVFPPDIKGRKDILTLYLKKVTKGPDIDVDRLARGTTGCTGADLENMVNQAALKAAMDGAPHITHAHMEYARDKVLMGPAKKTKIADDETNLMTAYHEAGHTLVAFYTRDSTPLHKVTIIPRGSSLGHTSFVPEKEQYNHSRAQLLAQMDVAMGGRVAEELVYGMDKVTTGASSDFSNATGIATAMVKKFGMSEKVGVRTFDDEAVDGGLSFYKVNELSPGMTELIDQEIKRLLAESYERAKTILKTHSAEHKALAQALMKYETLDADDIKSIVEGNKLSRKL